MSSIRKLTAIALTSLFASGANAATLGVLDVGGLAVEPPFGANVVENVATPGMVDQISFNLKVAHLGTSWGLETMVAVIAPDGSHYSFTGSDFGWGWGGVWVTAQSFAITPTSAAGLWTVLFNDSFDDESNPDYVTAKGSQVTLSGDVSVVPLPASAWLLIGGLAGAGAFLRRRRTD